MERQKEVERFYLLAVFAVCIVQLEPAQQVWRRGGVSAHRYVVEVGESLEIHLRRIATESRSDDLIPEIILPTGDANFRQFDHWLGNICWRVFLFIRWE